MSAPIAAQEHHDPSLNWLFADQGMFEPTGTIIADSGFRPYPNGFGFFNFGGDLRINQLLFAQPNFVAVGEPVVQPVSLNANDMRVLFGPGVCLDNNEKGPCVLTFSSQAVLDQTNGWAIGGRCFGMSNVAAGFYSGKVRSRTLQTGSVNAFTTLNENAQRQILRTVTSQYFSASGSQANSMRKLIDLLVADLSQGRISHTLLMYGVPGGHALTPYAIYDRGANQYDIAVYDSNHPNRELAIKVDVTGNSFTYRGATQVGRPALLWSSQDANNPASLWVGSVADSLRQQECTFCVRGATVSLVSFSPIPRENAGILDNIKVLRPNGAELDPSLYEVIKPIDSVLGPLVNGPVIKIAAGVPFAIALSGEDARVIQPFSMTITQNGSTRQINMESLTPQAAGFVGVGSLARSVSVLGTAFEKINVMQTIEGGGVSYSFSGTQLTGGESGGLYMLLNEKRQRVLLQDNRGRKSTWKLDIRSTRIKDFGFWESSTVRLPKKARIIIKYSDFRGSAGQPNAWIDLDSDGTKDRVIPLKSK